MKQAALCSPAKAALALCLLLACLAVASASTIRLHPEHRLYTDEFGRERYFHGLNVVYKSHPYLAPYESFDSEVSFSEEDMAYFEEWGLNVIRLGLIWAGAEPEQVRLFFLFLFLVCVLSVCLSISLCISISLSPYPSFTPYPY